MTEEYNKTTIEHHQLTEDDTRRLHHIVEQLVQSIVAMATFADLPPDLLASALNVRLLANFQVTTGLPMEDFLIHHKPQLDWYVDWLTDVQGAVELREAEGQTRQ